MRVTSCGAAVIAVLTLALPAWAHHSHGNYNMEASTSLKGTVKEVHWMNPHTFIYLEVMDAKGEPTTWSLEGQSVTQLVRKPGFNKDAIKPGDQVTVKCYPLRDGSNGCLLGTITTPKGEEKQFD